MSSELEAFARGVKKASETPDEANTEKAKKDAMARIESEGLENEYKEWLKKKEEEYGVDEVIFDGYTDSGRRRYLPNTVENASKVMKQQGRAASENVAPTFHTFVASVLESSGKLDDLRKNKKKLTSEHEDVTAFKEEWGKTYHELAKALNPNPERNFDEEGYFRLSEVANSKDPKAFAKKEYGVELTDEEVSKLHSLVEAIRTERPTMYFETKFERPVTFDEFSAAVVPNTLSPEVRKGLEASGIKLFEYDPAKENDRKRAFDEAMSSDGRIRFQKGDSDNLEEINDKYNSELSRYINNNMDKNEMVHIGVPHGAISLFMPKLPIVMRQRILNKATAKKHNVELSSLIDLPKRLSEPVFIFKRSDNAIGVLTEMQDRDGKNICVAIELNKTIQDGGEFLEVNDVRSIHGRDVSEIINPIISNGTLKWVDKKKGIEYLSSASRYVQQEIDKQNLSDAAKIIETFENPKYSDKLSDEQENPDERYRTSDEIDAEKTERETT